MQQIDVCLQACLLENSELGVSWTSEGYNIEKNWLLFLKTNWKGQECFPRFKLLILNLAGKDSPPPGWADKEQSCRIFSRTYLQILVQETSRGICNHSRQVYYSWKSSEKLLLLVLLEKVCVDSTLYLGRTRSSKQKDFNPLNSLYMELQVLCPLRYQYWLVSKKDFSFMQDFPSVCVKVLWQVQMTLSFFLQKWRK